MLGNFSFSLADRSSMPNLMTHFLQITKETDPIWFFPLERLFMCFIITPKYKFILSQRLIHILQIALVKTHSFRIWFEEKSILLGFNLYQKLIPIVVSNLSQDWLPAKRHSLLPFWPLRSYRLRFRFSRRFILFFPWILIVKFVF